MTLKGLIEDSGFPISFVATVMDTSTTEIGLLLSGTSAVENTNSLKIYRLAKLLGVTIEELAELQGGKDE